MNRYILNLKKFFNDEVKIKRSLIYFDLILSLLKLSLIVYLLQQNDELTKELHHKEFLNGFLHKLLNYL